MPEGGCLFFKFSFLSIFFFLLYLPALYRTKALKLCTKLVFCAEIFKKKARTMPENMPDHCNGPGCYPDALQWAGLLSRCTAMGRAVIPASVGG